MTCEGWARQVNLDWISQCCIVMTSVWVLHQYCSIIYNAEPYPCMPGIKIATKEEASLPVCLTTLLQWTLNKTMTVLPLIWLIGCAVTDHRALAWQAASQFLCQFCHHIMFCKYGFLLPTATFSQWLLRWHYSSNQDLACKKNCSILGFESLLHHNISDITNVQGKYMNLLFHFPSALVTNSQESVANSKRHVFRCIWAAGCSLSRFLQFQVWFRGKSQNPKLKWSVRLS